MAVPIDFLSASDRARLARSQGVTLANGDVYRRGVIVSAQDAARSAATRTRNDFLESQATKSNISIPSQIAVNPIAQVAPIGSLAAATPSPSFSPFDNRAIALVNQGARPAAVLTPQAPPTAEQVQQSAQALRAVNGLLPGRVYTDEALAKATPSQIVAEAGTLNTRLAFERERQEQAKRDAATAATSAVYGGTPATATATPTASFSPATLSSLGAGTAQVDGQPVQFAAPGSITVGGQPYTPPGGTPGTTQVNGTTLPAQTPPTQGLVSLGGPDLAPSATPTFAGPAASSTTPAVAGPARARAVAAIAKGNVTPEQANHLLSQADELDDPYGAIAAQRKLDIENQAAISRRGLEAKFFGTPEGQAELSLRQKQVDNVNSQLAGAQKQLDTKLQASDAQFADYVRGKVSGAIAGVTDKALKAQLASMTDRQKYEVLTANGYISESDSDKAKLKTIAEGRTFAEREYQDNSQTLRRLASDLVQSNPRLNFNMFGGAPADVTAAPATGASPFGGAPTPAQAASPFVQPPTAAAPAPTGVAPAPNVVAQPRSIDAQIRDLYFALGQPGADVRAIKAQLDTLQQTRQTNDAFNVQNARERAAAASAQQEAKLRFDQLATGQAGISAPLF